MCTPHAVCDSLHGCPSAALRPWHSRTHGAMEGKPKLTPGIASADTPGVSSAGRAWQGLAAPAAREAACLRALYFLPIVKEQTHSHSFVLTLGGRHRACRWHGRGGRGCGD